VTIESSVPVQTITSLLLLLIVAWGGQWGTAEANWRTARLAAAAALAEVPAPADQQPTAATLVARANAEEANRRSS
jgi:hypothetical protein